MPSLPEYGYVADRVLVGHGPQQIPATGTVVFVADREQQYGQATIAQTVVTCRIHAGAAEPGDPDDAKAGLLIGPSGVAGPVSLGVGRWSVQYVLDGDAEITGFRFDVHPHHTLAAPAWLPLLAPIRPAVRERLVVNEQVRIDAEAARDAAWAAAAAAGGNVDPAVVAAVIAQHFEEHPPLAELDDHIADPTPHPAYDVDMPRLDLIFENGLI